MHLLKKLFFISRNRIICNQLFKYTNQRAKPVLYNFQDITSRWRCDTVDYEELEDSIESHMYRQLSNEHLGNILGGHKVLIIQPYIKWGRNKKRITTRELQLQEAESLVNTLPFWTVVEKTYAPLLSFKRKHLLGSGGLTKIKNVVQTKGVTAIFVSIDSLKFVQSKALQELLEVEVFDRYSLIIHIFRTYAKTSESKLQIALAEIPYIRRKLNSMSESDVGAISSFDHRKKVLQARETMLKKKLEKLKEHRAMLRNNRKKNSNIPIISIVGYTNAGKTSLIKALTGDNSLIPKNRLFATLDTTLHKGILPCKMKVLFVDTIGFIQDVPEILIEPFKATLEDTIHADIIIHIYDISHPDKAAQIKHVQNTIESLFEDNAPSIINVANKCDLSNETVPDDDISVIANKSIGVDCLLHRIQTEILKTTGHKVMTMRVKTGSPAQAWIHKEMTVINAEADENDPQYSMLNVVTTDNLLYKFKRYLKQSL